MVHGVLGLVSGLASWLLVGHLSWTFFVPLLLFAALYFWVAVKLLQLRYWALIAGRLLALWLVVSYLALVALGRFVVGPPVLTLARVARFMVVIAIAITIFLPAVGKAIKQPQSSTTE